MIPVLSRLYGTLVVLRHTPGQARAPFRPADAWLADRDRNVRRAVRHAAAHVPHYRRLLQEQGIDPREIRTAEDLDRLPLLDKATVRRDPQSFVARTRAGAHSVPFMTSGSTGEPLTIYHDLESLLANIAYGERERSVVRELVSDSPCRQLDVNYAQGTIRKVWGLYRKHTFLRSPTRRRLLDFRQPLEEVLAEINGFRPHLLVGSGSYLEALYRTVVARRLVMHRPRLLMVTADGMTEPGRQLVEEQFGVPVLSRYNAVEAFKIGFVCPERRGFHLHQDLCNLKLVDETGARVPPGQRGEIVISNLVNRGTVLLNYRIGDTGVLASDPCPCGRSLPLLASLEGRMEDILELPDGRLVHPRSVWQVFKHRPEVLRYQLVQHEPDRFELRLTTADRADCGPLLTEVLSDLTELLGRVRIEAVRLDELEQTPDGKFRPVVAFRRSGRTDG